ncbi:MAG TPA: hypothetical protein VFD58_34745 [Blastocatellia bacterium]|nr:hypothetical protein [Blastocatellia bacterium]
MKRLLLVLLVIVLYVLHQDTWFWRTAQPFVFGFLPVGLFYHVCFTLAVCVLMWLLVRHAWPSHLEEEIEHSKAEEDSRP